MHRKPRDWIVFASSEQRPRSAAAQCDGRTLGSAAVLLFVALLLCGLLPTALLASREEARELQCSARLAELGLGMQAYAQVHGGLPPRRVFGPYRGWAPALLPYLGEVGLAAQYRMDKDFYDPLNRAVIGRRLPIFECPAAAPARRMEVTDLSSNVTGSIGAVGDYFGFNSARDPSMPSELRDNTLTAMVDERIRPLSEIIDGTSWTLLLTEQAGRPEHWVQGVRQPTDAGLAVPRFWGPWASFNVFQVVSYSADGQTKDGPCVVNCNNSQGVYSFHVGGANALFVDGSVRWLAQGMAPEVLFALATRNGGEIVGEQDLQSGE